MTDYTDLIAEARQAVEGHAPTESEVSAYRLADALEAALDESDTLRSLAGQAADALEALMNEKNALAAVIEKVRKLAIYKDYEMFGALDAAPADVLRDVKAQAWAEGHSAGLWASPDSAKNNPYREGSE